VPKWGSMRSQSGLALLVLVLTVAALALISMHSSVGKTELISADDRALLNPLNMMKQIAAINKWTDPEQQTAARVPKRAVLEAQVAARQQASRDKATLVAEAHTEAREGRHASKASTEFADKKVGNYEKQAQTLTEKSEEDSVTASELATKAQELDAEAKKQEQLSRSASAKGEHLIHKATIKSQQLKKQATVEDSEASHLVVYAKKLAQKMVKEEALDEMKKWMKANAATAASNRAERPVLRASRVRHAHRALAAAHAHAKVRTKVPLTALHARRSVRMAPKALTEGDKIRNEFGMWRTSQLTTYAHDHDLYTKTQYCNSRATAHSPSISELQRAFGTDWQDVPPRVASLAAVNGCMEALGLRARHSTAANLWEHGALKGKADAVRECAHGNNKACAQIADSPEAMLELKHMIPKQSAMKA